MGALMVADRWPTDRYQPGEPYINRAAPRNKGLAESDKKTEEGENKETRNTKTPAAFLSIVETPYRKRASPHQHWPKVTKTKTNRERVGRT